MQQKFPLNSVFKREGVCPLRIVGYTADKKYLLHKVLPATKHASLLSVFEEADLIEGAYLKRPDGRIILLVFKRPTGYWETTYPQEEIIMSHAELEMLAADHNAAVAYAEVATRRETGRTSSGALRFLAKDAVGKT
jgi:hypothetical protein